MDIRETVYARLWELGIPYEVTEHDPVYTMEDMQAQGLDQHGTLCKNLFVRDAKGKRHLLIVTRQDTAVRLQTLGEQLGLGKLSFASPQRLERCLGVTTGAVSPFGLLCEGARSVEVVLDQGLEGQTRLGLHPNDNTATLWISWDSLCRFIRAQGNSLTTVALGEMP